MRNRSNRIVTADKVVGVHYIEVYDDYRFNWKVAPE